MSKVCPRCAATVAAGETNHEYHCLEHQLVALYKIGIQRGLEGEATDGLVDDQAAGLIGRIMELAGEWRLAGKQPRREPGAAATLAAVGRAQAGLDIDTRVAKLLDWRDIGWLGGRPASGEAAWHDPRVIRRRYSQRLEDALPLLEHPLLRGYELLRVHRVTKESWEWHVAFRDRLGALETLLVAPTAPMAICRAALHVAAHPPQRDRAG